MGGKARGVKTSAACGAAYEPKTPVVALVERGTGRVRNVKPNARLITDEHAAYKAVAEDAEMRHETVVHSKDEYVRGDVHTNTVEGFFSLLKRGVNSIYHHVSRGHLGRYCDEFAFRYENRKVSDGRRAKMVVAGAEGKRLTYKQPARASALVQGDMEGASPEATAVLVSGDRRPRRKR